MDELAKLSPRSFFELNGITKKKHSNLSLEGIYKKKKKHQLKVIIHLLLNWQI